MGFFDDLWQSVQTVVTHPESLVTGDAYYPDNPSRQNRLDELTREVKELMAKNGEAFQSVTTAANQVSARLAAYGIQPEVHLYESPRLSLSGPAALLPLFEPPATRLALNISELCSGHGSEEDAALKLGIQLGLGALVPFNPIAMGVMNGQEKRDALQKGIAVAFTARQDLKQALLRNLALQRSLEAAAAALSTLRDVQEPEEVQDIVRRDAEKDAAAIAAVDYTAQAAQELQDLDQKMGSWTNEDHAVPA